MVVMLRRLDPTPQVHGDVRSGEKTRTCRSAFKNADIRAEEGRAPQFVRTGESPVSAETCIPLRASTDVPPSACAEKTVHTRVRTNKGKF